MQQMFLFSLIKTKKLNVNSGATYQPGIVGTYPSVMPSVVFDGGSAHRQWHGVTHLPTSEGWKAELA